MSVQHTETQANWQQHKPSVMLVRKSATLFLAGTVLLPRADSTGAHIEPYASAKERSETESVLCIHSAGVIPTGALELEPGAVSEVVGKPATANVG